MSEFDFVRQTLNEYFKKYFPQIKETNVGYKINVEKLDHNDLHIIFSAPARSPEILIKRSGKGIVLLLDFSNKSKIN
jgi:hypothetical protein